jgi:hypothetical protein
MPERTGTRSPRWRIRVGEVVWVDFARFELLVVCDEVDAYETPPESALAVAAGTRTPRTPRAQANRLCVDNGDFLFLSDAYGVS